MLVLAGCAGQYPPTVTAPAPALVQTTDGTSESDSRNCREFTAQVTVGGQPQQAVGMACQQPDGRWRVTQNTPGLPEQVYTLPPQAIYLYQSPEPYWDPWFYGPAFVGGPVFLTHGFHHFHHFHGFHHGGFHHGGFGHGGFGHGGFHGGRR
jgi:hypothetical protein